MNNNHTIVDVLDDFAKQTPNKIIYRYFVLNGKEKSNLTFAELRSNALNIAKTIQEKANIVDRVILLFDAGPEFIAPFMGCMYAGVIAIPVAPFSANTFEKSLVRIDLIAESSKTSLVLTDSTITKLLKFNAIKSSFKSAFIKLISLAIKDIQQLYVKKLPSLTTTITKELRYSNNDHYSPTPEEIVFLQYSSGSTGQPRCGAEPINGTLPIRLFEVCKPFGMGKNVFCPLFDLTENTLIVTGNKWNEENITARFLTSDLHQYTVQAVSKKDIIILRDMIQRHACKNAFVNKKYSILSEWKSLQAFKELKSKEQSAYFADNTLKD